MPWFHCDHLYLKRQSQEKQQVSVLSSVPSFFLLMEKWQWSWCSVLCSLFHTTQPLSLTFYLSSYIETLMIFSCRQQLQPFPMSTGPTVLPGDSSVSLFFSFSFFMVSSSTPVHFVQASGPSHNPLLLSRWSGLQIYRKTLSTLDKESERLLESSLQFSFHVLLLGKLTLSYPFQFCVFTLSLSPAPYFYN